MLQANDVSVEINNKTILENVKFEVPAGKITALIGLVIIFLFYLLTKSKLGDKILFSLIAGGALGNFYDRLTYYAVPDFIDFHFKNFHWFTFNLADIFITVGIIMLLVKELFINEKN